MKKSTLSIVNRHFRSKSASSSLTRTRLFWKTPLAKVVFLFLVGIILPTAFLVYLGLHSIRAETALLHKQAEERIGEAAGSMQNHAQEAITGVLKPYVDYIQNHPSLGFADLPALKELQRQQNADLLMVLDSQDHVLFPFKELTLSEGFALPDLDDRLVTQLRTAERYEFQSRDYPAALREYELLLNAVKNPRWKASLLTRMAGCLLKTHDVDRAEAVYQQILIDHDQELTESGDPFGLTTALQLAELSQGKGQRAQGAMLDQKTLHELFAGRWALPWRTEEFYGQRIAGYLEAAKDTLSTDQRRAVEETLSRWREREVQVRQIGEFNRHIWANLRTQLVSAQRLNVPTLLLPPHGQAVIYSPHMDSRSGERRFSLVAAIPASPLVEKWQHDLQPLAAASQIGFRIAPQVGEALAASSQQPRGSRWAWQRPLGGALPALTLQMAELRDYPVEQAVSQRQRVYLAMVGLAAVVILVALYTVWYAVRREMEVAQLKAGFVASISHELKTPLSIISLIGQTLKLKRYQSEEEAEDYYGMLAEETDRLKELIDEVLDFSRLLDNRKPYRRQETDLAALAQNTLNRCLRSVTPRSVEATFQAEQRPFTAFVDPEAMERVVLNLLDNAIKYSPVERSRVEVSLRSEGSEAVLEVADKGYGIPADEMGLVFERFFRGRSAIEHQKTNGVGLGLSLVKHIVEAHGGTISVQSQENEGSTFTVRFPLKEMA